MFLECYRKRYLPAIMSKMAIPQDEMDSSLV